MGSPTKKTGRHHPVKDLQKKMKKSIVDEGFEVLNDWTNGDINVNTMLIGGFNPSETC